MVGKGGVPKLPVSIARPKLALPTLPTTEVDTDSASTSKASTIAKKAPSITTAKLEPVTRVEPGPPKPDLIVKAEPAPVIEPIRPELHLEKKDEPVVPAAEEDDKADEAEATHPVPSTEVVGEAVSVRDQAIAALRGAGFFDRPIIGRSPEELSDDDLNELLAELARRSFVSEATGTDIHDVKDADFGNLLDATQHQVIEDVLGIPLDALTPVGKALVEAEIRDTTGTSSQGFRDLVDDLAAGTNDAGFIRPTDAWNTGAAGGATIVGGGTKGTTSGGGDGDSEEGSSDGDGGSGAGGDTGLDLGFEPSDRFAPIDGDDDSSESTTAPASGSDGGSGGGSDDSDDSDDEQVGTSFVGAIDGEEGGTTYVYYERDDGSIYVEGSDGSVREATPEEQTLYGSGGEATDDDDDDDDDDSSSSDDTSGSDSGGSEPSTEFTPSEDGVNFGDPFGLLPERQIVFEDDGATDPTDDGGAGGEVDSGYVRPVPDVSQPVDQDTRYVDLRNLTFSPPDDGVTDPVDSMATFSAIDDAASAAFAAFDASSFAARSFEGESDDAADSAATDDDGQDSGIPDFG